MRILGIGDYLELGSIYLRLAAEGHTVRVHVAEEGSRDVLAGLVTLANDWEAELPWIREAGDDGLIIFEDAGRGELQDQLRQDGYRVIGGSAFGDRLEQDRAFGQATLRDLGLQTLPTVTFTDFAEAIAFITAQPRRYVLKFHGSELPSDMNYVGMRDDGRDVIAVLMRRAKTWDEDYDEGPTFSLMDHVQGIEIGLGAFFNGHDFVGPINLDWEHKRLFAGDLGELTGEMGTVVTYRGGERLFAATLARAAPLLRAAKHVGYVNLNTITNARGVWPLEFTCRFGYPGFAILSALFAEPCATILQRVAAGSDQPAATHPGYACGIVLTVPPFPYHHGYDELAKGMIISLPDDLSPEDRRNLHYAEVARDGEHLVTAGQIGYLMVVTGAAPALDDARAAAYALAGRIAIPNVRYRNDIGAALSATGLAELAKLGWL
jgi:phosphoribosylamine--glycine ligase